MEDSCFHLSDFSQFLYTVCLGCGVCTPQYKKAAGIPYYIASVLALNRVADVEGKSVCTVGAVVIQCCVPVCERAVWESVCACISCVRLGLAC